MGKRYECLARIFIESNFSVAYFADVSGKYSDHRIFSRLELDSCAEMFSSFFRQISPVLDNLGLASVKVQGEIYLGEKSRTSCQK